ncbi:hypothetical protein G6F40_017024 [Rhizopus arrhizus]|nr:hypothetical protein G6F40_017024 [Rhizopus arrhizus]
MAAILTTIYLIGDDIAGWLRGDISVTGALIGRVEEWRSEIDAVKGALVHIKDLLGGAGQDPGLDYVPGQDGGTASVAGIRDDAHRADHRGRVLTGDRNLGNLEKLGSGKGADFRFVG